ncbi:SPOR domain-containing protein [Sphingobacterium hotanense]|uniref:SPOR domain-containing protein n=1 Tax=Sphingobacterium hotanense TaxID=649196 RepID=A0ABT7NJU3_9SPHI|nr:SPOR domain-containing protein [Sphingobacterium hotanense]MDM1047416.1 SPOR domain-containing protein [Sphingobacterium hotanense]
MIRKGFIVGCFFLVLCQFAQAQEGKVLVVKDSLIGLLQEYRAYYAINPSTSTKTPITLEEKKIDKHYAKRVKVRGFRVQIYSGSNRTEATNVQNSFLRQNSDMGAYLDYVEPNYRVKVGDFTSRSAATEYMRRLRGTYRNVFVFVEDVWVWQ